MKQTSKQHFVVWKNAVLCFLPGNRGACQKASRLRRLRRWRTMMIFSHLQERLHQNAT